MGAGASEPPRLIGEALLRVWSPPMAVEDELLDLARRLAAAGAEELIAHAADANEVVATKSVEVDPVTAADLAAERVVRDLLAAERPDDGVVGEEGDDVEGSTGIRWVIDPLDGTVSYSYGLPQWCISVACEDDQGGLVGVVLDPLREEEFWAVRRSGAHLGEATLHGSGRERLDLCLLGTGFNYDPDYRAFQGRLVAELLTEVRDIRRLGSAALDLCWTATGRLDAFLEHGLRPWDFAAGALICREAGLRVVDLPATELLPTGLLVAPPSLADQLLEAIDSALREPRVPSSGATP